MRTTVIISKRGEGYISTVAGKFGGGHQGARAGLTAYDAAATAARLMIEYSQSNNEGGDLMAPPEVLDLVPEHLRTIASRTEELAEIRECSKLNRTINGDDFEEREIERQKNLPRCQHGVPTGVACDKCNLNVQSEASSDDR